MFCNETSFVGGLWSVVLAAHTIPAPSKSATAYTALKPVAAHISTAADGAGVVACSCVSTVVVIAVRAKSIVPKRSRSKPRAVVRAGVRCSAVATHIGFIAAAPLLFLRVFSTACKHRSDEYQFYCFSLFHFHFFYRKGRKALKSF